MNLEEIKESELALEEIITDEEFEIEKKKQRNWFVRFLIWNWEIIFWCWEGFIGLFGF